MSQAQGSDDREEALDGEEDEKTGGAATEFPSEPASNAGLGTEVSPVVLEAMRVAEEACREIVRLSGFDLRVLAVPGDPVRIELQGPDAGWIIGRHGATLQELQYLVGRIVGHRVSRRVRVKVDVEGYLVRRENTLRALAHRMADRAVLERRAIELEPMSAAERRIVHLALADDRDVRTESVGEGPDRRVCILPVDEKTSRSSGASAPGSKGNAKE